MAVLLSPHAIQTMTIQNMANRRTPLSTIANAGNSPFRDVTGSAKRARSHSNVTQATENSTAQPPPSKRQTLEVEPRAPITPRKTRGEQAGRPHTPAQRQHASRTREAIRTTQKQDLDESMEKLRQWQKHNEKTFPTFVFFFESVPESARRECSRGIRNLGAREAPFFSKEVTHIVTTRTIPVEWDSNSTTTENTTAVSPQQRDKGSSRTIDPSVLERNSTLGSLTAMQKSIFTFETRRTPGSTSEVENRSVQPSDVLLRGKNMGMKIWGLDKLRRILDVMFEDAAPSNASNARTKLSNASSKAVQGRQQDLQQLISNEQLNGPTDRDARGVYHDTISFKGPYVYVRCVFERVRPIMVREWPKVANREDGEWPQFRSVSSGKCPFVAEDQRPRKPATKCAEEKPSAKEATACKENELTAPACMQPPALVGRKRPLLELENMGKPAAPTSQQLPPQINGEQASSRPGTSQGATLEARSKAIGGEPMASGMQASNITSAVRSQLISSTAAGPGAKAGTSREIHGLQRKVLGRTQSSTTPALTRSTAMTEIAGVANATRTGHETRAAKQRAQERMGQSRLAQVLETAVGGGGDDDELETERVEAKEKATVSEVPARRKATIRDKRELKPGYCENCREKFDDFEEHTYSKRHRKFATTKENWTELDELLEVLGRPQLRATHGHR